MSVAFAGPRSRLQGEAPTHRGATGCSFGASPNGHEWEPSCAPLADGSHALRSLSCQRATRPSSKRTSGPGALNSASIDVAGGPGAACEARCGASLTLRLVEDVAKTTAAHRLDREARRGDAESLALIVARRRSGVEDRDERRRCRSVWVRARCLAQPAPTSGRPRAPRLSARADRECYCERAD
jgi:hypothetical protein